MKFHHLGIVAADLAQGRQHLEALMGVACWTESYVDPIQKVTVQFGQDGSGLRFELVVPLDAGSPVSACLASRKNILNHLAYQVTDLDEQAQRLRGTGCIPVTSPAPAVAFNGARIQFFLSPMSFLVELIEGPPQDRA